MGRQLFQVIAAPLVEWLREVGFPLTHPAIRFYPDGSLWTDDDRALAWKHEQYGVTQYVQQFIHRRRTDGYGSCRFRAVAAFGGDEDVAPNYLLTYPGWYDHMLVEYDEQGLLMYPGIFKEAHRDEFDSRQVRVTIELYRRLNRTIVEELADVVRRWFVGIGSKGVFDDGGITSISAVMQYRGREAGFTLNAQHSGQDTMNTLYLAVLGWGLTSRQPLCTLNLAAKGDEMVFSSDSSVRLR